MNSDYYIPERFEKAIVLHALRVLKMNISNSPIIFSIDGPTGEGKTYQCKTILERVGCRVFALSASQFESQHAGEPARLVRETYNSAIEYIKESPKKIAAILIDDADVAFGNWGELVQYTVNTQGVIGELMSIADMSHNKNAIRVPIYLTGNDLKKIYAPLRRSGRMDFFYWEPNQDEKTMMIYYLFKDLTYEECTELILYVDNLCKKKELGSASISFYSSMTSHIYDNNLWENYLRNKRSNFDKNYFFAINQPKELTIRLKDMKQLSEIMIEQITLSQNDYTVSKKGK